MKSESKAEVDHQFAPQRRFQHQGVETMKNSVLPVALFAALSSFGMNAEAAPRSGADVAVAGSIAMPGSSTATLTNAAGLAGNRGTRLSLQVATPDPMDTPTYRGLFLGGNGVIGFSAGMDYLVSDGTDDAVRAIYGLALNVNALNLSVGLAGSTGVKTIDGTDFNFGLLFNPFSSLSFGATAMGLKDGVDSYGVGAAYSVVSGVDLVVDAAFDSDFENPELKPGIKISNQYAGISLSYGTGATAQFADEFSAGAYLRVGQRSELELNYNHGGALPKYHAAWTMSF
jgi:hypothetical protein